MAAETRTRTILQRGFATLKRELSVGENPKPTIISGICSDVLLGSSLKNIWKLRGMNSELCFYNSSKEKGRFVHK